MHLSLRLAFARTDCTPMTHCVPMGRNSLNSEIFNLFFYIFENVFFAVRSYRAIDTESI